jgi:DNA invertase Pin-like site-specific DNA recombinase
MENSGSKIAIYARKSTESDDRQVLSIDSQIKELRDFAKCQNLKIERVFTESKSAKSPGRPVFSELMTLVQKGKLNEVLCWKLDRLARNPVDGGALIWAMEDGHLKNIHTPQRTFINTGNDKFWMQLEFGMAKKYVDDLSDNVKRGRRAKIEKGWWPGLPPLGYLNDRNASTIIKDPERFPLVRKMWDMMITGDYAPRRIIDIASEQWGLRTRQFKRCGGGPLALSMVYKLFKNPFYYGMIPYQGGLYPGKHAPVVSKAEFDRVQELLDDRAKPRPKHHTFSFTGLIKCGECGASVTAEHQINRQGHEYVYYHCTKKKRMIPCSQKYIEVSKLEKQISEFLALLTISEEIKDWVIKLLRELLEEESKKDQASIESLNRRHEACRKEINELLNMKLRGLLTDEEYAKKKQELENERIRLKELAENGDGRFTQIIQRCEDAFEFASIAKEKFDNGTIIEKRAILGYTGSNLILKDEILQIEAQKPLFLIKNTIESSSLKNDRFEPQYLGLAKGRKTTQATALNGWCGLVEDVRTFYWENRTKLDQLALPAILKSK